MRVTSSLLIGLTLAGVAAAHAQETIRYRVEVSDPAARMYRIETELAATTDTLRLSLPAWTPGHYTLENYSRYVSGFEATDAADGRALDWDKADPDTWRILPDGAGRVRVAFDYWADTLGLSLSHLADDFGYFNGTNLFLFPEDAGHDFPAAVTFDLPDGWEVATELSEGDEPGTYTAADYHELVDNPTFLGEFAMDSVQVDGRWVRLAVYPARYFRDPARGMALDALERIAGFQHDLFEGPPYDRYTTFIYLATEPLPFYGGLEHSESHLDILPALAFEQAAFAFPIVYHLLAHEYYHTWNVKRLRPAELWPYDYDELQPTPLLWVSEGITDYYARVTLPRTGLGTANEFWESIRTSIASVTEEPPVAVEDASLETWIDPRGLAQNYYYDKGLLLGLFLDIQIRHATENRRSLDDVMRTLYVEHYLDGEGFTTDDFLGRVAEHVGDEWLSDFYERYVDGREPLPYESLLGRAGLSFAADTMSEPFLGVALAPLDTAMAVNAVEPGSTADRAGLRPGDLLLTIGGLRVRGEAWGQRFREAFADSVDSEIAIEYVRDGEPRTARARLGARERYDYDLGPAAQATEAEAAIRSGIVTGTVDRAED